MGERGAHASRLFSQSNVQRQAASETMSIASMTLKVAAAKAVAALALVGISAGAWAETDRKSMERYAAAIRKIESTNRYHITANAGRGRTALGAYQILNTN